MARPAPDNPPRCAEIGFTLLEAMVALTLVAVVFGAAYSALGGASRASARADVAMAALSRAESALARVGAETVLRPGRAVWREEGWTIVVEIDEHRADAATRWRRIGTAPFEVKVTATAPDAMGGAQRRLSALLLGPPP